jgi:hypothetical protein
MAIIDDLINHYVRVNEAIASQISFIENGGKIVHVGANREQAAEATADWLERLMKYQSEYESIIAKLHLTV